MTRRRPPCKNQYDSRVPMALLKANIHGPPPVYTSANVNFEKMLEFDELTGHFPRSNLPLILRNERDTSCVESGVSAKMSTAKGAHHENYSGSLNERALRSLLCSRCKLAIAQTTPSKQITKASKDAAMDKQKLDRRGTSISKLGQHTDQKRGAAHFQSEKVFPGSSLPNTRRTWRVSEKSNANVNRLFSLLRALDDLPRNKARAKRQTVGYKQCEHGKRRTKLSKPGRIIDAAGELILLQAGDLRPSRIFVVEEDEVLSGLLHVSSKRPAPLLTATGKVATTSSAATPGIRSTALQQSKRVPSIHNKNDQVTENGSVTSNWKDPKKSYEYNSDKCHIKDEVLEEGIVQFKDHKNHQEQIFPALKRPFSAERVETFKQDSLPPLYISHHSTTCVQSHKQSTTKEAAGLPMETTKTKAHHLRHTSLYSRDHRKRNGAESVQTDRRSSVSKRGLPPIVIPRVTAPLRGFSPWAGVAPSPCMFSSISDNFT